MRFSYAESMIDPSFYAPLARAAEDAGYDNFVVPDSVAYPRESDSTYPYNPYLIPWSNSLLTTEARKLW